MKQPRHYTVEVKFAPGTTPTQVQMGPDRSLQFGNQSGPIAPESGTWHFGYDRQNKPLPKELGVLPLDPNELQSESLLALKRFDCLIAVDTNTKVIRGESVSVGCAVQGTIDYDNLPHVQGSFWPTACLEFRNATIRPERVLWEKILVGVERSESYNSINALGLIVDSELDALPELNARKKSIRGTFFLPSKCHLLYSSADKGTEWLGYHMIRTCDRIASCALRAIEADPLLDSSLPSSTGNVYERYRPWQIALSKHDDTVSVTVAPSDMSNATGWRQA